MNAVSSFNINHSYYWRLLVGVGETSRQKKNIVVLYGFNRHRYIRRPIHQNSRNCVENYNFLSFFFIPVSTPCLSVRPSVRGCTPSGAVFVGLSLALRSNDQFQASHWFPPSSGYLVVYWTGHIGHF